MQASTNLYPFETLVLFQPIAIRDEAGNIIKQPTEVVVPVTFTMAASEEVARAQAFASIPKGHPGLENTDQLQITCRSFR